MKESGSGKAGRTRRIPEENFPGARQVKVVRQALTEQNQDAATFRIGTRVYIAVDDDAARARQRIESALDEQYGYFELKDSAPSRFRVRPSRGLKPATTVFRAQSRVRKMSQTRHKTVTSRR